MQLQLTLHTAQKNACLGFNYQYPLSSAIYRIIQRADEQYAAFLHNEGYRYGGKSFKFFTFSSIQTPFIPRGDRMLLQTGEAKLTVCFYLPAAAETFVRGLFMQQQIEIADAKSKVIFTVQQVAALPQLTDSERSSILLQPLSPLVVGRKNEGGNYNYRSPEDADFVDCLKYNWLQKWCTVHDASETDLSQLEKEIRITPRLFHHPPQQRLVTIKEGTEAETKIRGYTKFQLTVKAPATLIELALGAGLGLHNAQGFGCVGLSEPGF